MNVTGFIEFHTAQSVVEVLRQALLITGFVFMMMLVIEYLNVLTRGAWQRKLTGHRWGQYVLAAALGATPGCLGAFAVVAMYSHRAVTLGAVVAAMIATSGDATFTMLAVAPGIALAIMGLCFAVGIPAGWLTDRLFGPRLSVLREGQQLFEVHAREECFAHGELVNQWRDCTAARGILAAVLALFMLGIITGQFDHGHAREPAEEHHEHESVESEHAEDEHGHDEHAHDEHTEDEHGHGHGHGGWGWIRITLLIATAAVLFIVITVPDHFLDEHLWRHVARKHVPQVFLWTLGALLVLFLLKQQLDLATVVRENRWIVLVVACLVGIIPDANPHLIFVYAFADPEIGLPFSILFANSIIQDGHGMLPLLAHSRRVFAGVKTINFVIGAVVGAVLLALGL